MPGSFSENLGLWYSPIFKSCLRLFYNKRKTGDLLAYASNDVNALRMAFGPALVMSIRGIALFVIAAVGLVQRLGGGTAFRILLPIPVVVFFMLNLGSTIRLGFRRVQVGLGLIFDGVNENISGIPVIKACVQEGAQMQQFNELAEDLAKKFSIIRVSGPMGQRASSAAATLQPVPTTSI